MVDYHLAPCLCVVLFQAQLYMESKQRKAVCFLKFLALDRRRLVTPGCFLHHDQVHSGDKADLNSGTRFQVVHRLGIFILTAISSQWLITVWALVFVLYCSKFDFMRSLN